jgi:3-hydroxy-9,10-secoandrosta-1,3,5(10)-triene-9,17-dione monooxygenase reductase component
VTSLDTSHFKEVVGHYATGLVIVSSHSDEGPAGFTCQTFGSLSLEPPLVLFAASTNGNSWQRVQRSATIAVNVLGADQEPLARLFATSGIDKFRETPWGSAPGGSPLLEGAVAHLEGQVVSIVTFGDHDVCVLEVTYAHASREHPLIYFRGGFGALA